VSQRPNILIIYPDQMRADAMSCAGNPVIRTPHIDRLALEGVRFTQAYTAFPLCCPFRASLFTGRYPHASGMRANHYPIPLNQDFLPQILRDHGYQTGYVGKWHLDGGIKHGFVPPGPRRLGFDWFVGFNRGHAYFGSIYYRDDGQPRTSRRYEPEYQTDHLIEFMAKASQDPEGRPFFAEICYGLPHPPLVAPDYYLQLYRPDEVPVRSNTPQDPEALARARRFLAGYYGLVACVDYQVGRILSWLDRQGLAENTLVLFVSDHGEMAGEHGRYGKKTYYEASMRVPMIVRYPARFRGGRTIEAQVDPSVDTMATLLELCGISIPEQNQGVSYLSLLDETAKSTRDAIYYQVCAEREGPERFPVAERGLRTREWLYVRTEARPLALYHLPSDPLEVNNLVADARYADVLEELDGQLGQQMNALEDDWGLEAHFPPPDFQTHAEGERYRQELIRKAIVEP